MIPGLILLAFVITCIFLVIHLTKKHAKAELENEINDEINKIEAERQRIASRPSANADELLERMRNPDNDKQMS